MGIRQVAAQRAIGKGPSLTIPTARGPLPLVPSRSGSTMVRNDHKSNGSDRPSGLSGKGKG